MTYTVVVALVAIMLIKNVLEISNNKGDLVVALVAIIFIKKMEILKVKDSLFQTMEFTIVQDLHVLIYVAVYFLFQLIFVFPLF